MVKTNRPVNAAGEVNTSETSGTACFSTGLVAGLAAITMLFAAFSSAYIVRRGLSSDWRALELPHILWVSPLLMIAGAAALMWGHRRSAIISGAIAGLAIVESCRELVTAGVSSESNPGAAFFYIFSAGFVLCLVAGMITLVRGGTRSTSLYWRYLAGLWSWLLLLLEVWR